MSWFKRQIKGIITPSHKKKQMPDGIWYKNSDGSLIPVKDLEDNLFVSPCDSFHIQIGSKEYFKILFNDNIFSSVNDDLVAIDNLNFVDTISYKERLSSAKEKTLLLDAIRTAYGYINDLEIMVACMDFSFIGGSMGCVVGEKISRAVDISIEKKIPLLIISKSGGARMMESAFSLMQMAKTSAKLSQLSKYKIPYISLMTNPTTGGVSASYAMLGDINIAEPKALIGFAGPRVIRETIKNELPKNFQTAEFLLEKGFIDFIVDRRELKQQITKVLKLLM